MITKEFFIIIFPNLTPQSSYPTTSRMEEEKDKNTTIIEHTAELTIPVMNV